MREIAAEREEDGEYTDLQSLAYQFLSQAHVNVVNRILWDKNKTERIELYSYIIYNIYQNYQYVTIAGACFTDSALYKL
jgi:hypothetical protein